jgi:PKD repeat protein
VKGKKEDKVLRELFRNKLENAEVIPSESFGPALIKSLGIREFLHFIPTRFNIWYLGGIVATGAILALFLVSDAGKKDDLQPGNLSDTIAESQTNVSGNPVILEVPSVITAEKNKQTVVPGKKNKVVSNDSDVPDKKSQIPVSEKLVSAPQNITGNISGKEIFNGRIEGLDKLQSGNKQVNNLIEASVTHGCTPLRVRFKGTVDPLASYRWEFGDGGFSEAKEPEWLFDIEGEYEVQLQVTAKNGSRSVSATLIIVYPKPAARFEITPEDAVIPDDEIIFQNYSSGAARYKWDFGDGSTSELFEPRHKFRQFGNYNIRLVVQSEYGCTDTVVMGNAFAGSGYFISFPNAFIPNPEGPSGGYYSPKSDEAAHVFHPAFAGVSDYQLKIFTRLGILIFETDDINIGWDGYFKGQLSDPGVYIWKVRGSFVNGEPFTRMGDVTLLKN